jgi:hypothetical protein
MNKNLSPSAVLYAVSGVSKDHFASIFSVKYSRYPEEGGKMLLRDIDNYSPIDMSYHHFNLYSTTVRALNFANIDRIGKMVPQTD